MARRELIERTHRSVSRLARSFQQLMREQLSCGPVTVQQCYTLAALTQGPRTMKSLAADVGLHQSTLTRVVEKLERQGLLQRERDGNDQRTVRVALTDAGREMHAKLDAGSKLLVGHLLDGVSADEQNAVVTGLELLARVLDPHGDAFRDLLSRCCTPRDDLATLDEQERSATA
ncbi:MAG: MarR family winged helix-turn-helix transcriptional regulator [Candidatus Binatia bacterium]